MTSWLGPITGAGNKDKSGRVETKTFMTYGDQGLAEKQFINSGV